MARSYYCDDRGRIARAAQEAVSGYGPPHVSLVGCNPTTSDTEYTDEERRFLAAIDRYKRKHHRPFPTWREILAIVHALGYRLSEDHAHDRAAEVPESVPHQPR